MHAKTFPKHGSFNLGLTVGIGLAALTPRFTVQSPYIFLPPTPIDWLGDIFFALSVVCKKKTLTFARTFEWYMIELSYFTCVFLVVRLSLLYQGQGHLTRSNIKVTSSILCSNGLNKK